MRPFGVLFILPFFILRSAYILHSDYIHEKQCLSGLILGARFAVSIFLKGGIQYVSRRQS